MTIWPKIDSIERAKAAAHWQASICLLIGAATGAISIMAMLRNHPIWGIDGFGTVDSTFFFFCGWRVWKLSLIVSILALAVYVLEVINKVVENGAHGNSILAVIFILGMIEGLRGTIAYRKYAAGLATDDPANHSAAANGRSRFLDFIAPNHRHRILMGISSGVGLAIGIVGLIWIGNIYRHRSSALRTWPRIQFSDSAVNVTLKTQWKEGLRYVLRVEPSSPDYSEAFSEAAQYPQAVSFSFLLYDSSGFKVCEAEAAGLERVIGNDGKVIALESNGETFSCPADNYREASNWNISYNFPVLVKSASGSGTH